MENLNQVQMINDNYDIIHNSNVKEKYPSLYEEVCKHDKVSTSSWFTFSEKAYEEYETYVNDKNIGYIG